jgi:hypothetical protein
MKYEQVIHIFTGDGETQELSDMARAWKRRGSIVTDIALRLPPDKLRRANRKTAHIGGGKADLCTIGTIIKVWKSGCVRAHVNLHNVRTNREVETHSQESLTERARSLAEVRHHRDWPSIRRILDVDPKPVWLKVLAEIDHK